jgi:hypothetical protein
MNNKTIQLTDDLDNPRVELRSTIIGLCFACPFDQGNPEGCLFHEIRKRPMSERFAWVIHLNDATMETLCEKHHRCLALKEAEPVRHREASTGAVCTR